MPTDEVVSLPVPPCIGVDRYNGWLDELNVQPPPEAIRGHCSRCSQVPGLLERVLELTAEERVTVDRLRLLCATKGMVTGRADLLALLAIIDRRMVLEAKLKEKNDDQR